MRHPVGPQPVVRRTEIPFSIDDRKILLVDDVLYTGRTIRAALDALDRLRPAARHPAHRAGRPRPSRAADQGGLRRQEPADVVEAERPGAAPGDRRRGRSGHRGGGMTTSTETPSADRRAEVAAPARHRGARRRRNHADPRHRRGDEGDRRPRDQESADAARPDRRQPVLRAEHAHADVVRDRRKAAERRHAQHRDRDVERDQGGDAPRHRPQPRGDVARHDRDAPRLVRRAAPARPHLPVGDHQRRRRHARAPDAGAARRLHDPRAQGTPRRTEGRDRRRPAAQPRAAVERPAAEDDGGGGLGVRARDADAVAASSASACTRRRRSTRRSRAPTS